MASFTLQSNVKLASGYEMPLLGFGVYETPADDAERCVKEALAAGYRHVDSAASYRNEAPCGKAIGSSGIPRSDVFFTSKVRSKGMSYESAKATVDETLQLTGLDYIDLMLLHAPYGGSAIRKGAWKALVEAVEDGKVRSIGVSNYGVHHLDELVQHISELETERGGEGRGGVVSVGQWEMHPWLPHDDIVDWARKHGVAVQAYCPLVRGSRWEEECLRGLAEKHGKTAAQVLLRWSLQKGYIPLPKSVTASRIRENTEIYDFELSEDDMAKLVTNEYSHCAWDPTKSPLDNFR